MRQSKLFPKTLRETPADADNVSTALLIRGGFIHKVMAGVYNYQPLGLRVFKKIEQIIREEMNAIGGQEIFMSALQSKELWDKTGRWDKLKGDMYQFKDASEREVGLAMTHEEAMTDILGQQPLSYQDFPIKVYQFQDKFRNEPRAKSGLLRTREFIMKDLYSNHVNEADFKEFYEEAKAAYIRIFERLGIPTVITLASGGIFTSDFSHEFQSKCDIGEDTIYACPEDDYAVNDEVLDRTGDMCPHHNKKLEPHRAVEVGNIFPLGTQFSEKVGVLFTDQDGVQKPFWSGSYGIGLGRAMGVIVELSHDDNGIIWPASVAPYQLHLIDLTKSPEEKEQAETLYNQLQQAGIEVLYDDRQASAGAKFTDADLLGMPYRAVVSAKTIAAGNVELKKRTEKEAELLPLDSFVDTVKARLLQ